MVFTHLPSNVLLILVPFMPSLPWAVALLLLRFSISQMDVPARQSYTMAVVSPMSARGVRRDRGGPLGWGSSVAFIGYLVPWVPATNWHAVHLGRWSENCVRPALYRSFVAHRPPEETGD